MELQEGIFQNKYLDDEVEIYRGITATVEYTFTYKVTPENTPDGVVGFDIEIIALDEMKVQEVYDDDKNSIVLDPKYMREIRRYFWVYTLDYAEADLFKKSGEWINYSMNMERK